MIFNVLVIDVVVGISIGIEDEKIVIQRDVFLLVGNGQGSAGTVFSDVY